MGSACSAMEAVFRIDPTFSQIMPQLGLNSESFNGVESIRDIAHFFIFFSRISQTINFMFILVRDQVGKLSHAT